MRKVIVMAALGLLLALQPALAAPPQQDEGQAHTIQPGETLGALAFRIYGDFLAWPAIVQATNNRAAADNRFRPINDPGQVQAGQMVWLPGPAEASRLLGRAVSAPGLSRVPSRALPSVAGPAELTPALLAEFDAFIETTREQYQIPGAAVAVFSADDTTGVVLAKGYGLRELGRPEPVTPETIFALGSTTKAMTTMLVASLVDDGLLAWDQPVVDIWPEFRLSDPAVTRRLTLRQLFNMSSGLARKDLVWSGAGLSAEEIMASLAELPLLAPPGSRYGYNNQAVATGGYVAALAAGGEYGQLGQAYADLLRARVFEPIGMSSARLEPPDLPAATPEGGSAGNYAIPHDIDLDGRITPTHFHADPGISPAGAVLANVLDMARFGQTQLNQGIAPNGNRVVSAENLAETWRPQTRVTDDLSYGLGWFIEDYQGVELIWHDGDVLGSKSLIMLIPEAGVGLVVLTNRMISTGFSYTVRYRLVEMLYGLESTKAGPFAAQWEGFLATIKELRSRQSPTVDPAAVAPYLGQYSGGWRVELGPATPEGGSTLYAIRGPYHWQLMAFVTPSYTPERDYPPRDPAARYEEFMIANGFGISVPLLFETGPTGAVRMTFKLYSGEVGAYEKLE